MSIELKQKIRFIIEIMLALLVIVSTIVNFAVSNAELKFDLSQIKTEVVTIKQSVANLEKLQNDHLRIAEHKIAELDMLQASFQRLSGKVDRIELRNLEIP